MNELDSEEMGSAFIYEENWSHIAELLKKEKGPG
jgi:hypothetical protein